MSVSSCLGHLLAEGDLGKPLLFMAFRCEGHVWAIEQLFNDTWDFVVGSNLEWEIECYLARIYRPSLRVVNAS